MSTPRSKSKVAVARAQMRVSTSPRTPRDRESPRGKDSSSPRSGRRAGSALAAAQLPTMDKLDLSNTAPRVLQSASSAYGYIKVNKQRRYAVLWRHPDDTAGEFVVLLYESLTQKAPKETITLKRSCSVVVRDPPDKNYKHCCMLTVETEEYLLVADDEESMDAWEAGLKEGCGSSSSTAATAAKEIEEEELDGEHDAVVEHFVGPEREDLETFVENALQAIHTNPEFTVFEGHSLTEPSG